MKRFLVISDTHGSPWRVDLALAQAGHVDLVLHCGDGIGDLPEGVSALSVRGNCDFALDVPAVRLWEEEGVRIMMAHGHTLGVKEGLLRLLDAAAQNRADVVCFGHTHQQLYEKRGGILLLNPGCLRAYKPYYGILEVGENVARGNLYHLVVNE